MKTAILRDFHRGSVRYSFGTLLLDNWYDVERFEASGTEEKEVTIMLIGYDDIMTNRDPSDPGYLEKPQTKHADFPTDESGRLLPFQRKWSALAIEQVSPEKEDAVFRRIGLVQGMDDNKSDGWFKDCPRRDLKLI